jgi:hypothetical protein
MGTEELQELFVRASSREDAKEQVLEEMPNVTFYR